MTTSRSPQQVRYYSVQAYLSNGGHSYIVNNVWGPHTFAEVYSGIINLRGIVVRDLAEALGTDPSKVYSTRNGRRSADNTIERLTTITGREIKALGFTHDDLMFLLTYYLLDKKELKYIERVHALPIARMWAHRMMSTYWNPKTW